MKEIYDMKEYHEYHAWYMKEACEFYEWNMKELECQAQEY